MDSDALPERLKQLVDFLRTQKDQQHVTLTEVASVTEVLIATMSGYFKSIDTTIYREFRYLSDYISRARGEISQLHPVELKTRQIPRAGRELDAIVAATEEATNTIMEAAETIMAADPSDAEAYKETVNNSVMSIFEACSFQDITGQRISKVIETLSVIEQRLNRLGEVWGSDGSSLPAEADQETPAFDNDNPTMSGPALEGEGIDQEGVDALLSSEDTAEQAVETAMEFDDPDPVEPMSQDDMLTGEDIDDLLPSTEDTSYVSPAPVQQNIEYGTAEQLVRAVETLLQEDADDLASIEGEIEATERAERQEVGEASNDDFPPQRAPAKAAVGGGGKGKTTQADIDALFS